MRQHGLHVCCLCMFIVQLGWMVCTMTIMGYHMYAFNKEIDGNAVVSIITQCVLMIVMLMVSWIGGYTSAGDIVVGGLFLFLRRSEASISLCFLAL